MNIPAAWLIVALPLLSGCAATPGIDRPMPLSEDYLSREDSAREAWDRCGPEFIQLNMPAPVVSLLGPLMDGPFGPVCQRHDACYRLQEHSQTWCDERMRTEMIDICNDGRPADSAAAALCRFRADLYHGMVDNRFGAYAYEGVAGGRIASVEVTQPAAGELSVCVTAENNSKLLQEYVVELRTKDGKRIDRSPRFKETAVRAGTAATFCAGTTTSTYWSLRRLTGPLEVTLLADPPDSISLSDKLVLLETRSVALPAED
jgi:hypothetical protein